MNSGKQSPCTCRPDTGRCRRSTTNRTPIAGSRRPSDLSVVRTSVRYMGSVVFEKCISSMDADLDTVLGESVDSLTTAEKTSFLYRLETFTRRPDAARNHFLTVMA